MTVAFQVSSESHTGTTGASSVASFSWNHAFTASSKGLVVFVYGFAAATDIITSVTASSTNVPLIGSAALSFAADTVTEPGFVEVYFLASGLPTTTASITVNRTNNSTVTYANAITVTATNALQITGLVEFNENDSITSIPIDDGETYLSSLRMMGMYTGAATPPTANSATTVGPTGLSIDIGAYGAGTYYESAEGVGRRSIGFNAVHNDDTALIAFAISESLPSGTLRVRVNNKYDSYQNFTSGLSGNWLQVGGPNIIASGGNAASSGGGTAVAVYNGTIFDTNQVSNQWAQARVAVATIGTSFTGVVVRNASGVTFADGYYWRLGTSFYTLTKRLSSGSTALFISNIVPAVNDVIKLVAIGSTLYCYVNGTIVQTVVDTDLPYGKPGIAITGTTARLDDLYIGTVDDYQKNLTSTTAVSQTISFIDAYPVNSVQENIASDPAIIVSAATDTTLGTVTQSATELTGGSTSNVTISWTTVANHTYQILRTDLAFPALVVSETSSPSVTLLYSESISPEGSPNSGLVDLPLEGVSADYTIQVKLPTANGGNGLWYDGTGTNHPFNILRINEPTLDDTQDFNSYSPTPISHTVSLKLTGLGGTLEYGWNTTGSPQQSAVTNWQSSATFANAFSRGSTYYFYARRSTDEADFDVSTAQTVIPLATYGLQVFDNAGVLVLDTNSLPVNIITTKNAGGGEITDVSLTGQSTATVYAEGLTSTNTSDVFIISRGPSKISGGVITTGYSITRGNGSFVVKNTNTAGSSAQTIYFTVGTYV